LWVYVNNGVISRIEEFDSSTHVSQWDRAWRKRVYAANRVQYPMQRVDFDPAGARNPQNRGISGYVRISWDEATSIVASEMSRAVSMYGNSSIFSLADCGWSSTGTLTTGVFDDFLNLYGGYTPLVGDYSEWGLDIGETYIFGTNCSESAAAGVTTWAAILANTKYFLMFGSNFATTTHPASFGDVIPSYFMQAKQKGIKFIIVDPLYTEAAVALGAQWIPILPGTDIAMMAAMAYVMITNKTYDTNFINNYTVGFSQFSDYILGTSDGTPKTPEWASSICGVDAQTITNLANLVSSQASQPVLMYSGCGPQRNANGDTFQRMLATVTSMSGNMGIAGGGYGSTPWGAGLGVPAGVTDATYGALALPVVANPVTNYIVYNRWADAVLNPGGTYQYSCQNRTYPNIKFLWKVAGVNWLNQHGDVNKSVTAIRAVDFYVSQDPWMVPASTYADIILPACTTFERNDITAGWNYLIFMQQAIQPLYDSMSDYNIFSMIAQKLGTGQKLTQGNTDLQWVQSMFTATKVPMSWSDFSTQGYYQFPSVAMQSTTAFQAFRQDPTSNALPSPSGKIEIFSQRIATFYGTSTPVTWPGVPTIPMWIEPFEWKGSAIASQYPLAIIASHEMLRLHSQFDNVTWLQEKSKINGFTPVWINPTDAQSRGINDGDTVRVFNGRGQTLASAMVTNRIVPGVVRIAEGGWFNPSDPSVAGSLDIGGCVNVLTTDNGTSNLAQGCTGHTALVQVEEWVAPTTTTSATSKTTSSM